MPALNLDSATTLPRDGTAGALAGRIWHPTHGGPAVVAVREDGVFDVTAYFPTMRDLAERTDPADALRAATGERVGSLDEILANTLPDTRNAGKPWLLAPVDLQAVKAAGVTFAVSMLERVIEERARGDHAAAAGIRAEIVALVGEDFSKLRPGSEKAMRLKAALIARGAWSQYLEVGIGPDAEIFTKAQPMAAVGSGADAGLHPSSAWNNPEPEAVLVVSSEGRIVGATLGNDVNLRDVEGRSALLLGKAKDNNASCALGPFVRFFDSTFTLDHLRAMEIALRVEGPEGYRLDGGSSMSKISRDPADLAAEMIGRNHQYPDGAVLFLGTLFAPVEDRDAPGQGFTHKVDDIVTVSCPELGSLVNRMRLCADCAPWTYGTSHLMRHLAGRGVL
ncbi:MAG: fumarylacetoacetate hydrolase family protein [Janthinobacterium lividum]